MAAHTSPHATPSNGTESQAVQKSIQDLPLHQELSPTLQALERIAKKKYSPYLDVASRSDDAQETFSSQMTNFMKGNHLTTRVALLAASLLEAKS